ncbi:MAG: CBS domain-containing protein [Ignavibacteriales bacterium]|jgi:CIC family chloride channel protein|nr:chloride channel protein [Ignavibacteriaceae bacterium]NLH60554.1 CBS domain-containing protein [Ignavibacteriales bacterium]HOJ17466.1 chloride channel protein [Ignavibacteriaceae bacterium]HPO54754.1 chloride channel protein [Ignavibacteriaceae bacterium]
MKLFQNPFVKINKIARIINLPDYTKFLIISVFIGGAVGFAAVIFHRSIEFFNRLFFEQTAGGLYFLGAAAVITIPAIGMLIQALMIRLFPEISKHRGVPEIIKTVSVQGGRIPLRTTIFHFLAPVICIGSGGTVGPEGPAAQLGGGVANKLSSVIGMGDQRRRIFTAAGAGAAIAAIFNSPLGGIFFALEIIMLNNFQSTTFSALILSSVTASSISRIFIRNTSVFEFGIPDVGGYRYLHLFAIMGVAIGLISLMFIRYSLFSDKIIKKKLLGRVPQWALMVIVGLIVGTTGFFYKDILGIGYEGINNILAGRNSLQIVAVLLVMKFILVPLILNSGGFGGMFAPALFMGACSGFLFSQFLIHVWGIQVDPTTFILVGMGAMLGGINSIPISAILIIFEMTRDYSFILPLMLAVVISTMIIQISYKGSIHTHHLRQQGYRLNNSEDHAILNRIKISEVMKPRIMLIDCSTPLPMLLTEMVNSQADTFYLKNNQGRINGVITSQMLRPILTEFNQLKDVLIAEDLASKDIVLVTGDDTLDSVMKLFEKKDYDEFPVIAGVEEPGSAQRVLGVIRRKDVIAAYNKERIKLNLADSFATELKTIEKEERSKVADGYSIMVINPPAEFLGSTLAELNIRNRFGLEVLMIKKPVDPYSDELEKIIQPAGDYVVSEGDNLYIFGKDENLKAVTREQ